MKTLERLYVRSVAELDQVWADVVASLRDPHTLAVAMRLTLRLERGDPYPVVRNLTEPEARVLSVLAVLALAEAMARAARQDGGLDPEPQGARKQPTNERSTSWMTWIARCLGKWWTGR